MLAILKALMLVASGAVPDMRTCPIRRFVNGIFAGVVLMAISQAATAALTNCDYLSGTATVQMPSSVAVPRDAAVGTLLTPWGAASEQYGYSCDFSDSGIVGLFFRQSGLTNSGLTVVGPRGGSYTVWNTNLPGIGIAIVPRVRSGDLYWAGFEIVGGRYCREYCDYHNSQRVTLFTSAQAALVKTGPVSAGVVNGAVLFRALAATRDPYYPGPTVNVYGSRPFFVTATTITVASCQTPDVTVNVGTYPQSAFRGIGSTTNPVGFNVKLNNCPAGLSRIQVDFSPVNQVLDANNGVIALDGNSTAKGIGLQIKYASSRAPVKYDTWTAVPQYTGAAGSYAIPMTVNYYQTGQTVTPGSANGMMTFTMNYQ